MIVIEDYNPHWKGYFEELKKEIWPKISKWSLGIEHVGSTSVEGLAAKPIIDIDIVVKDLSNLSAIVNALASIGYTHRGNLGIDKREAFIIDSPKYAHNLYVCVEGSTALNNHLILRDHLRKNEEDKKRYSNVKKELAEKFPDNIDEYLEGKTALILEILSSYDFDTNELADIKSVNKNPNKKNKERLLPEFETQRLYLRGVRLEDSGSYEKNFANYDVIQHLSHHVPWPYPKGSVKSFLEDRILPEQGETRWLWVIFEKDKRDEVIGCVDLWRKGCPENRGFWLAKEHWGKGFMTEAVHPVIDYAFSSLGFEKLIFANAVGNDRSRRIKEKTGAVYIENRPAKFVNKDYTEHEIWELTKENWERFKGK